MNDNRPRAARPEGIGKAGDSRVIKLDRGTLDRWRRTLALRRLRTRTDVTCSHAQGVVRLPPRSGGENPVEQVIDPSQPMSSEGCSEALAQYMLERLDPHPVRSPWHTGSLCSY